MQGDTAVQTDGDSARKANIINVLRKWAQSSILSRSTSYPNEIKSGGDLHPLICRARPRQ